MSIKVMKIHTAVAKRTKYKINDQYTTEMKSFYVDMK